jgi:hypothetical protein
MTPIAADHMTRFAMPHAFLAGYAEYSVKGAGHSMLRPINSCGRIVSPMHGIR